MRWCTSLTRRLLTNGPDLYWRSEPSPFRIARAARRICKTAWRRGLRAYRLAHRHIYRAAYRPPAGRRPRHGFAIGQLLPREAVPPARPPRQLGSLLSHGTTRPCTTRSLDPRKAYLRPRGYRPTNGPPHVPRVGPAADQRQPTARPSLGTDAAVGASPPVPHSDGQVPLPQPTPLTGGRRPSPLPTVACCASSGRHAPTTRPTGPTGAYRPSPYRRGGLGPG